MDYKKYILNELLTKYENSKHYLEEAAVNRRVLLKFNRSEFPQYDIEKWNLKDTINSAVKELKAQGVIDFKWKKYEEGNIIESVWLEIENLQKAYSLAVRIPKADEVSKTLDRLNGFMSDLNTHWIREFIGSSIETMISKRKFTKYIPQDEELQELIMKALKGIEDKGEEEILERIFSTRYLGGSKVFEKKIRSRLLTIIKDFMLEGEELEEEEVLQQVGIIKTSEDILFRGPLIVELKDSIIDFKRFIYGASMNTQTIRNFTVKAFGAKRVITIENKANYLEYIDKNTDDGELVIYLAGFYSPVKRIFLKKLYDFVSDTSLEVDFYHWGDIDLGGFRIFVQLREIIKELRPMRMDIETLRESIEFCDEIDEEYSGKLKGLLGDERYGVFREVIGYMVEKGVRLEQEVLL